MELIQSDHILIPSCCFNQWGAGVADLSSTASVPPFSLLVWKICVIWLPPPLVLIREECSGSSGSGSLAPIYHGQAWFHAHRSHTSSHSCPVAAQAVLFGAGGEVSLWDQEGTEWEKAYFSPFDHTLGSKSVTPLTHSCTANCVWKPDMKMC